MKLFTLESLIIVLLLASIAAVTTNHFFVRELAIELNDDWQCDPADDRSDQGKSRAKVYKTDDSYLLEFKVRDNHSNPFAAMIVRPTDGSTFDWSWMESVEVDSRYQCDKPKSNHLHFQFRSIEDKYTNASDPTSMKYNGVVLQPTEEFAKTSFDVTDFVVPSWWIQKFNVEPDDRRAEFDQVRYVEITTMAREVKGTFELKRITIKGHWVSMASLSQGLLGVWMTSFLGVLFYRVCMLRCELRDKQVLENELLALNDALSLKSQELSEMASQDPLTGLFNRRGARDFILAAMSELKQSGTEFSLIMFDIDRFKQINDVHGHVLGDKILCDVATISRHRVRNCDSITRWGGEEFLIICPATDREQAAVLAESLRREFEDSEFNYTASFGICSSSGFESFSQILEAVDKAMYNAKENGRNCIADFQDIQVVENVGRPAGLFPSLASNTSNINLNVSSEAN